MSGYKLVMGFLAILITMFLWIPLGYVFDLVAVALNSGITDATTISHNNSMVSLFYYLLFFIILVIVIYVIKTEKGEEESGEIVYMPAAPPQQLSGIPPGSPGTWRITLLLIGILLLVATTPNSIQAEPIWSGKVLYVHGSFPLNTSDGLGAVNPVSLVFNDSGYYWVANHNSPYGIYRFNSSGAPHEYQCVPSGITQGTYAMTTNSTTTINDLWIYDIGTDNITHIDSQCNIIDAFDVEVYTAAGRGLTTNNTNEPLTDLWFLDGTNDEILHFDASGNYLDNISITSEANGWGLQILSDGTFIIADNGVPIADSVIFHHVSSNGTLIESLTSTEILGYVRGIHTIDETHFSVTKYSVALDARVYNISFINATNLILGVSPDPIYNETGANFSILYQQFNALAANITINASSDSPTWNVGNTSYASVAHGTTLYFYVAPGNYTKHDNITIYVNATLTGGDYSFMTFTWEIQNSPPTAPSITLSPVAVIIGDNMTASGSSTDGDGESITYWYRFGYDNWTNITDWILSNNLTILEGYEYETILAWVMGDDGEENGTAAYNDMNVTNLDITYPTPGLEIIGKTISFSFNFTTNLWHQCFDNISGTLYNLGYITGSQNTTRTIDYGNQTYEVVCYSLANSSITYSKNVSFYNSYSNWNVSIYTENDWNTPLNIADGNVSIQINCIGGSQFVYNFTGVTLEYITPECDVETITAKVDYPSDSYTRERLPPDCTECEVRMYMIDATEYTVLQIPIYMSDYAYYDSIIEIYKESGGNHYTISEGYFDVERKYITYLTKDNKYLIRIKLGSEIRDIGFLYAATATAQYLSLSEISLRPSVTLISNNIQMYAEFDDITQNQSTLRIRYIDLLNQTEYVRIQVYSGFNTTAWYDSTFYSDNVTVTLNNINTSPRQNVKFTVSHESLGNSPIVYVTAAGTGSGIDFGLGSSLSWVYQAIAFFVMIMTIFIIVPEIRIPGYLILIAELGIFSWFGWFAYEYGSIALLLMFLVGGIIYELKYRGVDK